MLRQRARPLPPEEIKSAAVRQFIELMRKTMRDALGVGPAAPQVGEPEPIAVMEDTAERQQTLPANILVEGSNRTGVPARPTARRLTPARPSA